MSEQEKNAVTRAKFENLQKEIEALSREDKDESLSNMKDSLNRQIPWHAKLFYYLERFIGIKLFIGLNFRDRSKLNVLYTLNTERAKDICFYGTSKLTFEDIWAFTWHSSSQLTPKGKERVIGDMDKMLLYGDVKDLLNDCLANIKAESEPQKKEIMEQEGQIIEAENEREEITLDQELSKKNTVEVVQADTPLPVIQEGDSESADRPQECNDVLASLSDRSTPSYFVQNTLNEQRESQGKQLETSIRP